MFVKLILYCGLIFVCTHVYGQQNYFNVPSSEVTAKNKVFFQQQVNFFPSLVVSNSTFCYGLGKKSEIGLNLFGVTYDYNLQKFLHNEPGEQTVYPTFGVNGLKQLYQYKNYALSVGGELLSTLDFTQLEYYLYVNNKFNFKKVEFVIGLNFGNDNYFGKDNNSFNNDYNVGIQFGLEYQIIKEKLLFQTDFVSGAGPFSNFIIGGAYYLNKKLILSLGYQFPNDRYYSANCIVFELTFIQ